MNKNRHPKLSRKYFWKQMAAVLLAVAGLCVNAAAVTTVTIDPGTGGTSFQGKTFSFDDLNGHNLDPIGPLEFVFKDSKFITLSMNDDLAFNVVLKLTFSESSTGFVPVATGSLRVSANTIASNDHSTGGGITDTYSMTWLIWNDPLIDGFKFSSAYFNNVRIATHPENATIVSASLSFGFGGNIHNGEAEIGPVPEGDDFLILPLRNGKAAIWDCRMP